VAGHVQNHEGKGSAGDVEETQHGRLARQRICIRVARRRNDRDTVFVLPAPGGQEARVETLRREAEFVRGFGVDNREISPKEFQAMWPEARIDDVLAAFDKAVDRCERNGDANDETFDFGPMHVDNATDESSRMLHVEALDPERMEAAGLFGGALAPKESGSLVELMRHREPIQIVDFYVL